MQDPRLLYDFDPELWDRVRGTHPVFVHLFDGYMDAGMTGHNLRAHLLEQCTSRELMRLDADQLIDWRGRRPIMTFDTQRWVNVVEPDLIVLLMTAPNGQDFLMAVGPEPDYQWRRTAAAFLRLIDHAEPRLSITAHGAPMQVPHSRPTRLIRHVSRDTSPWAEEKPLFAERVDVPGSFSGYLEHAIGQDGHDILGITAQVPHYLTQSGFPQATLEILRLINQVTDLNIPEADLPKLTADNLAMIATELTDAPELAEAVAGMETTYDELAADPSRGVPSADEIGAEFERYLAQENDRRDDKEEGW